MTFLNVDIRTFRNLECPYCEISNTTFLYAKVQRVKVLEEEDLAGGLKTKYEILSGLMSIYTVWADTGGWQHIRTNVNTIDNILSK